MTSYAYNSRTYEDYNRFAAGSLRSKGAQTLSGKKGTKSTSKAKHDLKVKRLKNVLSRMLIIIMILMGLIKGVDYGIDHISRHIKYDHALEDFRPRFVSLLTEAGVDFAISKDNEIIILDNDNQVFQDLNSTLSDKVGLSSHESAYVLEKICGEEAFEKCVQSMGYKNSEDFFIDNYFKGPLSSSGTTFYAKYPDKKKFENLQENGVYEKLTNLQENDQAKIQEFLRLNENGKGMTK